MSHDTDACGFLLLCVIVNSGSGGKVTHLLKEYGMKGDTVFLGKGTADSRILQFIGLSDIRKEIVLSVGDRTAVRKVLEVLNEELDFKKANHGIAFTTSLCIVEGSRYCRLNGTETEAAEASEASEAAGATGAADVTDVTEVTEVTKRGVPGIMYHIITAVVDKGNADHVIEAAIEAGSKGGTIINARGSGIHETARLFNMEIEPEKEVVIILSSKDKTQPIVCSIRKKLRMDEPGNGIVYVQTVNEAYGLHE